MVDAGAATAVATEGRRPAVLAGELFLLLLPSGHLLFIPVAGAMATATDLALGLLVLAWVFELLAYPGGAAALGSSLGGGGESGAPNRRFVLGLAVLAAFGLWVAASGAWGFHPRYALAKGTAAVALAVAGLALATSRISWRQAADAWLVGTALALGLTLVLALAGPDVLQGRVIYQQGGVMGLPFPRISGPLLHPNMMGDYLVVSAVLLWARWPSLSAQGRRWATALAAAIAVGLFLTVSTAWVSAGVALILLGRGGGLGRWGGLARVVGAVGAATTLVTILVPLDFSFLGADVVSSGIRPQIWKGSLYPILDSPLLGVGAAPYLAEAADPLWGGAVGLWDAHNAYLSVLGQFGLVGLALGALGVFWTVSGGVKATGDPRVRTALTVALIAVAVNALFMASEDVRHVWVLLGLCGVAGASVGARPPRPAP